MCITAKLIGIGLMLGVAATSLADDPQHVPTTIQNELIGYASSDFAQNGPAPQEVRNVHIRHDALPTGEPSYLLCGEFRTSADDAGGAWTHFATIRTDPYEQWIGGLAQAHCERASVIPSQPNELSAALQARLDASKPE